MQKLKKEGRKPLFQALQKVKEGIFVFKSQAFHISGLKQFVGIDYISWKLL